MASLILLTLPLLALSAPNHPAPHKSQCTTTLPALDVPLGVEKTIYTTTTVVYASVPCNGCVLETASRAPSKEQHAKSTVTAKGALTTTSTVCAPDAPNAQNELKKRTPPPEPETRTCTITKALEGSFTFGLTKTAWTKTVTSTQRIDCGGCQHVAVSGRDFAQVQDVIRVGWLTTSTAKTAYTRTTYACRKTPGVAIPVPPALPSDRDEGDNDGIAEREVEVEKRGPVPEYTIYRPTTSARPGTPCTITALVSPTDDMGPTTTLYPRGTVKAREGVECRGCKVESHTMVLNWFVSPVYEATETYTGYSTALAFACTDK